MISFSRAMRADCSTPVVRQQVRASKTSKSRYR